MKRGLLYMITFSILISCVPYIGGKTKFPLPSKGQILDFSIVAVNESITREEYIIIMLNFRNFSDNEIYIEEPNCYGKNIMAFPYDSNGNPLSLQFLMNLRCLPELRKLERNESCAIKFPYKLDYLYNFNAPGIYELRFAYYGAVLNAEGEKIANDCSTFSNLIKIELTD